MTAPGISPLSQIFASPITLANAMKTGKFGHETSLAMSFLSSSSRAHGITDLEQAIRRYSIARTKEEREHALQNTIIILEEHAERLKEVVDKAGRGFSEQARRFASPEMLRAELADAYASRRVKPSLQAATRFGLDLFQQVVTHEGTGKNEAWHATDSIDFKGSWQHPFNEAIIREHGFYTGDGVVKALIMARTGSYRYHQDQARNFEVIQLPYDDENLSMTLFLPRRTSNLEAFQKNLTPENWSRWIELLQETPPREGFIAMPKFRTEYDVPLNGMLKTSAVNHKAVVEVHEKGTGAVAEAKIKSQPRSGTSFAFQMIVNRPFLFAITDNTTQLPIFMGLTVSP